MTDAYDPPTGSDGSPNALGLPNNVPNEAILFTDRSSDAQGVGVLRQLGTLQGEPTYAPVQYISLLSLGLDPASGGRPAQVFGVSDAAGIAYVPAGTFQIADPTKPQNQIPDPLHPGQTIPDTNGLMPNPGYAVITGFDAFVPGDPKHDPNIGPISPVIPATALAGRSGFQQFGELLSAGGNVGFVRTPLAPFNAPNNNQPRLIAATANIPTSFPDNVTFNSATGLGYAAFQAQDAVFVYDFKGFIQAIEADHYAHPTPASSIYTYIPIDDFTIDTNKGKPYTKGFPQYDIRADEQYFTRTTLGGGGLKKVINQQLIFGVPDRVPFLTNPFSIQPNPFGVIDSTVAGQPPNPQVNQFSQLPPSSDFVRGVALQPPLQPPTITGNSPYNFQSHVTTLQSADVAGDHAEHRRYRHAWCRRLPQNTRAGDVSVGWHDPRTRSQL